MNNRDKRKVQHRRFFTALTVSVLLHVLLVSGGLYLQYLTGVNHRQLKTVEVSLVMLPGPGSSEEADMADVPLAIPEPEPVPEPPAKQPPVPVEPKKPEPVKKVPKKVPDKPRQPKRAPVKEKLKELEQTVQQKKPSEIERALARLQQEVKKGPPSNLYKRSGPGLGKGSGNYGAPMSPFESYLVEIAMIIRQNWLFTPQLIRERGDVKAYVAMTIQPDGSVSNIVFDRKSVSEYFNDTVFKAIEKSSPLPPVPEEVSRRALKIGLVFTPQGIE